MLVKDERGWVVPLEGTKTRLVYDAMRGGNSSAAIIAALSWAMTATQVYNAIGYIRGTQATERQQFKARSSRFDRLTRLSRQFQERAKV